MGKILKVITSEFLPSSVDRSVDTVYFVYDKMAIYLGHNFYSDPFCIVEKLPDKPIEGMLYITMDGKLKSYQDGKEVEIGEIESADQIELLKKAGSVYFMKAEYRYLDLQTRTLQLPFHNGTYQLSISMTKDTVIDENTVIVYNPQNKIFEIHSDIIDDEEADDLLNSYKGVKSSTVETVVKDNKIHADLVISPNENNILKVLHNGLYANLNDVVNSAEFEQLAASYESYKIAIEAYIKELEEVIETAEFNVNEDSIAVKILEELQKYEPTIDDIINDYEYIYEQLGYIRESIITYTDDKFETTKNEIIEYITNITNAWEEFNYKGSNYMEPEAMMTNTEAEVQADVLENLREKFIALREIDGGYVVPINFFIATNNNGLDGISSINVLPNLIEIVSEQASKVGYTRLLVNPGKENINNKYYWKITNNVPKAGEDVTKTGYTLWDGVNDIYIPNGSNIILVEMNQLYQAIKFGRVTVRSRLQEPKELELLDIVSIEGSNEGFTKLSITPAKEAGNIYMYKKATTIPEYDSTLPIDYIEWDGVSELNRVANDMDLLCIVECTHDFHKAKKVGIVRINNTDELLELLTVTSEEGDSCYYTIVKAFPEKINGNRYYYKVSESNALPSVNSYLASNTDGWHIWNGTSPIYTNTLEEYVIIAECDSSDRVKKAGVVKGIYNNTLETLILDYSSNKELENIINVYTTPAGNTSLYYKVFGSTEPRVELKHEDAIPANYTKISDTGAFSITVTEGIKIGFAEVYPNNTVRRFNFYDPVIKFAEDLSFTVSLVDNTLTISGITVDSNYKYAVQLLSTDDEQPYLNQKVELSDSCLEWDGTSTINIDSTDTLIGIRVYQYTDYIGVQYSGKASI